MATEKLLVKTKDNCVMVFNITYQNPAERLRLAQECENKCSGINYRDGFNERFNSAISYDTSNTQFLNREISGYHYRKDRAHFNNGMRDDPQAQPNTLYLSHQMRDDEFPEMIKNLGFEIVPVDKTYDVRYNSTAGKFETSPEYETKMASVQSEAKRLDVVRNHFHFEPTDYSRLQELISDFENARRTNRHLTEGEFAQNHLTLQRDRALFWFYGHEVERCQHKDSIVMHELKHIKNAVFDSGLSLKNDNKRLSVDNYYRIEVEDERSAYLEQLVHDINKYLQNGDMSDFSMFDSENQHIVNELRSLGSDAQRRALATNWPQLVAAKLRNFETQHRSYYDNGQEGVPPVYDSEGDNQLRQFLVNTKKRVTGAPLNALEDTDKSEFKKLRSLYYNFQIYNPDTNQMESVNLSQFITPELEVAISPQIQSEIIEPLQQRMQNRLDQFERDKSLGAFDTHLIALAKALMRSNLSNHEFVTDVDNFRIASLYEQDNTPPPPSSPTPVPADHADWSDELRQYWQQVEGYSEIAKNNDEYKFRINDTTVRYTGKKQVEISNNADYDLYDKMLKEPTNRAAPVEFLDTLSDEQKLLLYVACVNNGRRMTGYVPTDLSGIEHLQGIPPAEMERFHHRQQQQQQNSTPPHQSRSLHQPQSPTSQSTRQAILNRRLRGR